MQQAGKGSPVTERSYRLLRAILNTAVEDMLIAMDPCNLKGAGLDHTPERPVATIDEVFQLADAVPRRYRALVLLAAFTTLREAELFALRRDRVDLAAGTVEVVEQVHTLRDGSHITGEPKTKAGRRIVSIPEAILPIVRDHLDRFAEQGRNGRLFVGEKEAPLRRNHWGTVWRKATASVGMEGLRFHGLRHPGNTLAAASGASTKELMARMGHASPRAALIYQHATRERDEVIARALSEAILRGTSRSGRRRP